MARLNRCTASPRSTGIFWLMGITFDFLEWITVLKVMKANSIRVVTIKAYIMGATLNAGISLYPNIIKDLNDAQSGYYTTIKQFWLTVIHVAKKCRSNLPYSGQHQIYKLLGSSFNTLFRIFTGLIIH